MLREVTPDDSRDIQRINNTELNKGCTLADTTSYLTTLLKDPHQHVLRVSVDPLTDQVLAYIHAELLTFTYMQPMFIITTLAVSSAYDYDKHASALLTSLINLARRRRMTTVRLGFIPDPATTAFWTQAGFIPQSHGLWDCTI